MLSVKENTSSKASKSSGLVQVESQEMPSLVESERNTGETTLTASADQLRAVLAELTRLNLTKSLATEELIHKAGGGYCDVFIGYVRRGSSRVKVAVRKLRTHIMSDRDFLKVCLLLNSKINIKVTLPVRCSRKKSRSGRHFIIPTYSLCTDSSSETIWKTSPLFRSGWRMEQPTSM